MVFIMPAFKRYSATLVIGLALVCAAPAMAAGFEIDQIKAQFKSRTLIISGQLDLGLTARVEEALNKGIPLDIEIDLRLYRQRHYLWALEVERWVLRRQLRFHALSGQYIVINRDQKPISTETFTSLSEALQYVGALATTEFPLTALPEKGLHRISLKVALDIESLPAPLRPVAYTSLAWRLNSGWSTWPVGR